MRAAMLVALLVVASGCSRAVTPATGPGVPGAHVHAVQNHEGVTTRVYAVGPDIPPGVYTTRSAECSAAAASSARYDEMSIGDSDDFLRGSARVGDLQRIVLRKGEFFHVDCGRWTREDGSRPASPDPETRTGACTILTGKDRLADTAVGVTVTGRSDADDWAVGILQAKLMAVVFAQATSLWRPAGQLVDYLDDPAGYHEHGKVIGKVSRALARIHAVCGR